MKNHQEECKRDGELSPNEMERIHGGVLPTIDWDPQLNGGCPLIRNEFMYALDRLG